MKIYWKKSKIRKKTEALAASNPRVAKRMIDIKAAKNFLDIEPPCNGRAHFLKGKLSSLFAVDICCQSNPNRFICIPYGNFQKDVNGNYLKETITELLILKIERDYHK